MKKILAFTLIIIFSIMLVGCSSGSPKTLPIASYAVEDDINAMFHQGLVCVENSNSQYGFMDKNGHIVIDFQYNEGSRFGDSGYAVIDSDNVIIDKYNNVVSEGKIIQNIVPKSGYAVYKDIKKDKYGIIDSNNDFVVKPIYDSILDYPEDNIFIGYDYDTLDHTFYNFSNDVKKTFYHSRPIYWISGEKGFGLAKQEDDSYKFINEKGEYTSDKTFDLLGYGADGYFGLVNTYENNTNTFGVVDRFGNVILPNEFDQKIDYNSNGLAFARKLIDGLYEYQLYDLNGDLATNEIFRAIYSYKTFDLNFNNGVQWLKTDYSQRIVNDKLETIYNCPKNYSIYDYNDRAVVIKANEKSEYKIFDYQGKEITYSVNPITLFQTADSYYLIQTNKISDTSLNDRPIFNLYNLNGDLLISNISSIDLSKDGYFEFEYGYAVVREITDLSTGSFKYILIDDNGNVINDYLSSANINDRNNFDTDHFYGKSDGYIELRINNKETIINDQGESICGFYKAIY